MSNHSLDISIATEYKSVEIAILVWHFQYWIMRNARLGRNFHDDHTWTYQTLPEIAAIFPYWSVKQVERLVLKAVKLKIIKKGNYNRSKYDRTAWYSFENEKKFSIPRNREMVNPKSGNGKPEIGAPIPNTITDTLTDKEKEIDKEKKSPSKSKPKKSQPILDSKQSYGSDGLVTMTIKEHDNLLEAWGEKALKELIERLQDYIGSSGKAYKSHYHTLKQWRRSDLEKLSATIVPKRTGTKLNFEKPGHDDGWKPNKDAIQEMIKRKKKEKEEEEKRQSEERKGEEQINAPA